MLKSKASSRMFSNRARVKRPPPVNETTGIRGEPIIVYENMPITPIDPISRETLQRQVTDSPIDLYEAFVTSEYKILNGDDVIELHTERTFKVRAPMDWPGAQIQLVLELQKTT